MADEHYAVPGDKPGLRFADHSDSDVTKSEAEEQTFGQSDGVTKRYPALGRKDLPLKASVEPPSTSARRFRSPLEILDEADETFVAPQTEVAFDVGEEELREQHGEAADHIFFEDTFTKEVTSLGTFVMPPVMGTPSAAIEESSRFALSEDEVTQVQSPDSLPIAVQAESNVDVIKDMISSSGNTSTDMDALAAIPVARPKHLAAKPQTLAARTDTAVAKPKAIAAKLKTVVPPPKAIAARSKAGLPRPKPVAPKAVIPKTSAVAVKPLAVAAKPLAVAAKPLAVAAKPLAVAAKPLAVAAKPLAVAARPSADFPRPLAVAARPSADFPRPLADLPKPRTTLPKPVAEPSVAAPVHSVARPEPSVATPEPSIAAPDPSNANSTMTSDAEFELIKTIDETSADLRKSGLKLWIALPTLAFTLALVGGLWGFSGSSGKKTVADVREQEGAGRQLQSAKGTETEQAVGSERAEPFVAEAEAEVEVEREVEEVLAEVEKAEPAVVEKSSSPEREIARPRAPKPEPVPDRTAALDHYRTATAAFMQGKIANAERGFQAALRADPSYSLSWRGLGLAYEQRGARVKAVSALRRYLKRTPSAGDADRIRTRITQLSN